MGVSVLFSAALILATTWQIMVVVYGIIGFLQGGYFASTMTMHMDVTNPRIAATQFSVFTSIGNAGMTFGESGIGTLVALFGFTGTFLYSAWVFGPALLVLYFIRFKRQIRNK